MLEGVLVYVVRRMTQHIIEVDASSIRGTTLFNKKKENLEKPASRGQRGEEEKKKEERKEESPFVGHWTS